MSFNFGQQQSTAVGAGIPSTGSASLVPRPAAPAFGASTPAPSVIGQTPGSVGIVAPQAQSTSFAPPVATVKPAQPASGLSLFSTPTTTTTSLQFGAPQSTTGGFGTATSVPSTSTTGLFSGLAPPKPTIQFGTTTASPSLNFGTGSTFSSLAPASSASSGFNLGVSSAPSTSTSVGLGGVDTTVSSSGLTSLSGLAGAQASRPDAKSPKETQIPDDIARGVEAFKQYVKKQKSFSSEIARCSSKPLLKVQEDTDAMKQVLSGNTAGLQRLKSIADKLKADTAKALQHTEMAQRTHDTPAGLQYDNTAPLQYFAELVTAFERDIRLFRQEIENAERHVHTRTQMAGITPAELTQAMRRLYDSFVALAGRLHAVHSQVKSQKEQYLSLRKYLLNDTSDVFDEAARNRVNTESLTSAGKSTSGSRNMVGPTPFSALSAQHSFGLLSAGAPARQNFSAVGSLGWGNSGGASGSTSIPITPHPDSSQFQLQKPPSGNKRGKR